MFIDSHCHLHLLDLEAEQGDADQVIQRARDAGVHHMLCVCTELGEVPQLRALADSHPDITFSVGVHPNHLPRQEVLLEQLNHLSNHDKCIAIGETGLDYFRQEDDVDWQRTRFRLHIDAAKQTQKPLIIHTRQAREDTITIMQEQQARDIGGVMHCFTESWDMAKQAMDMGFYISFSGIVTFKNAKELQEVARQVPLDLMLIETDCPYLAPVPFRGKQNEPAYVQHVAQFIADLRHESLETIAQKTTDNFNRLFKLPS